MKIPITKPIRAVLLAEEFQVAFPEWGTLYAVVPLTDLTREGIQSYLRLPDDVDLSRAQAVLDAHDPSRLTRAEMDDQQAQTAKVTFRTLPNWATWTPDQGRDYVTANVLTGQSKAEVDAWIDTNVTTLATAKTGLKLLAAAILDLRLIVATLAYAVLLLRDVVVRRQG